MTETKYFIVEAEVDKINLISDDVLEPLLDDLNTPGYIANLHKLYEKSQNGSLKDKDFQSSEDSPYFPNSPYSASKASGDHLARAWYETFGLPIITTNCTNNYGPFQHEEKLIPLKIFYLISQQ